MDIDKQIRVAKILGYQTDKDPQGWSIHTPDGMPIPVSWEKTEAGAWSHVPDWTTHEGMGILLERMEVVNISKGNFNLWLVYPDNDKNKFCAHVNLPTAVMGSFLAKFKGVE